MAAAIPGLDLLRETLLGHVGLSAPRRRTVQNRAREHSEV